MTKFEEMLAAYTLSKEKVLEIYGANMIRLKAPTNKKANRRVGATADQTDEWYKQKAWEGTRSDVSTFIKDAATAAGFPCPMMREHETVDETYVEDGVEKTRKVFAYDDEEQPIFKPFPDYDPEAASVLQSLWQKKIWARADAIVASMGVHEEGVVQ